MARTEPFCGFMTMIMPILDAGLGQADTQSAL